MSRSSKADRRTPFPLPRHVVRGVGAILAAALLLAGLASCRGKSSSSSGAARGRVSAEDAEVREEVLRHALRNLYNEEKGSSEEVVQQVLDRLNQWLQGQPPAADWTVDPMAAPLVQAATDFAGQLKPIRAAFEKPSRELGLKSLARQFDVPAAQLEALSRRRSASDLRDLDQRCERFLDQLRSSMKRFQSAEQLDELEKAVAEALKRRLRDPAKLKRFQEVAELALQLDYPDRLREPARLDRFARDLARLAGAWDHAELRRLVAMVAQINEQIAGTIKTKTTIELEFLAEFIDQASALGDLAELKQIRKNMEPLAENVKRLGKRTGREDIAALSPKVEAARKRMDIEEIQGLAAQMDNLAKARDLADLKTCAAELADASKRLADLSGRMTDFAKKADLPNLQALGQYVGHLAEQVGGAARLLANPPPSSDSQKAQSELDAFTGRFLTLAGQVEQLAGELDYLATLGAAEFPAGDQVTLHEAVLLKDLSRWARGDEPDDVERARRLFDWTVRNIQLAPDNPSQLQLPWETLFFGQGTAIERSWVFILLARYQGLDAALLALEDPADPLHERVRPWVVAVLSEGNLYLFEPALGLPIPGPDGLRLDESGQLSVRPATLAQVVADDRLLRQLDLDRDHPYPVTSSRLNRVVALVEGSPPYLARRMQLLESRLAGEDRLAVSAAPTAQAERLKRCKHVSEVRLWPLPFEALFQRSWRGEEGTAWLAQKMAPFHLGPTPVLRTARLLHLRGRFHGEDERDGAGSLYQAARPSDAELQKLRQFDPQDRLVPLLQLAKQSASYWLGLIAFDQGNYVSAEDYLKTRTLDVWPNGVWASGAKYNLGRTYEALKKYPDALRLYQDNSTSVEYLGNLLRAKWLASLAKTDVPPTSKPQTGKPKPEKGEIPMLPGLPDLPGLPEEPAPAKKPVPKISTPGEPKPGPKAEEKPRP